MNIWERVLIDDTHQIIVDYGRNLLVTHCGTGMDLDNLCADENKERE